MKAVIAVDALGGDYAPDEIIKGVVESLSESQHQIVLVGLPSIRKLAVNYLNDRLEFEVAKEQVAMEEPPVQAVREKPESSMAVGLKLVRGGRAHAFVSAGNTGAVMAYALLHLGRLKGVSRPAIAVILPGPKGPEVLIDAGANAACRPAYLPQFAYMGKVYAEKNLGISEPKVGLLNIGEEEKKGSEFTRQAYQLLKQIPGFIGNVEGKDLFKKKADVIVTDGFTGNVVLKTMEGMAESITLALKESLLGSFWARVGGKLAQPALKAFSRRLSYEEYGGAQLLGVKGVVAIAHGRSKSRAISNAILVAERAVLNNTVGELEKELESTHLDERSEEESLEK